MPKVFISYSHDSDQHRKLVLDLSDRLNINDIDCDIDQYVNGSPDEGWPLWMEKKLNEAAFVLVVCTKIYLDRVQRKAIPSAGKGVKWESLLAYQDIYDNDSLNQKYVPIIFNIADAEFIPNPLKAVTHYDLGKASSYEMLCRYLTMQPLAVKPSPNQKLHLPPINTLQSFHAISVDASPKNSYDPHNAAILIPFRPKGKYMVGRDEALEKVRQQLLEGKPTSIGQTALFQGIGGLGKTQLAVEYAHHFCKEYINGVYWITADENIDAQLTQIAVAAHWVAPESDHAIKLAVARNRIKTYSDCLIIFDNLELMEAIREYLPDLSATPHILVTSRSEHPEFANVKLDLLDDAQSYSMLIQEAGRRPTDEKEELASREIVAALSGLPLALELAGAFLAHRHISWCAYRDLLLEDLEQALPSQFASLTGHAADLFKTLRISEQEISEEPLLADVLDLLTWSGSSPMRLQLMAYLLNVKPSELYGALGLGKALRLLQEVPNSERYAAHRLVQEVRRHDHPLSQLNNNWSNTIAQRLGDWFEAIRKDFRQLPTFELELEHLLAWQVNAEFFSPVASVRLLWLQAYPSYHRGRYLEAADIVRRSLAANEDYDFGPSSLKANILNDLSHCYANRGEFPLAVKFGEQALEMRRNLLGEQHEDIAFSLCNLSGYYSEFGNQPLALKLGEQALEMRRNLLGSKHEDVATSLGSLASIRSRLGDAQLSLELSKQSLEMRRELFGERHPDVASSLGNLACRYSEIGDNSQSLKLNEQALEMRRELLGEKHPDVAISLINQAYDHDKLGNKDISLELGEQAIKLQLEMLGKKHPNVATSLNNLAYSYERIGNPAYALDLGMKALNIRRELLQESHPDTCASLMFVAKRLSRNPSTSIRCRTLVNEYLRHIPHNHSSYQKIASFASSLKGFRAPAKIGNAKKQKNRK